MVKGKSGISPGLRIEDLHPTDEDLSVGTPDLGHPDCFALIRRWIGGRRRRGSILGAEKRDDLHDLGVGERVAERRHLLPAIRDLLGDLFRRPCGIGPDVGERRPLFVSVQVRAVALGAAFVAIENGAGLLVGPGGGLGEWISGGGGQES